MDAARWRQIEDLYHSALSRTPEDRPAFLRDACGGDSDLQQRVQSLLHAEEQAGDFLEHRAPEDDASERPPQAEIGSYRILHRLGAGGMGEVYRAHDSKLGRDVAMKTLPSEFARDADRIARLRREARTLASLSHPNLGAIHDLLETDAGCYLVLELVEGQSLRGPVPLDAALDCARQVAAGLHAAHSKGIVHRDLKPSNVIVTPEGRVKVLDFGLAKTAPAIDDSRQPLDLAAADQSATLTGQIAGTPPYMSPEQIRGEVTGKRTDIWAFGCLLYELLTGRRAFDGKTVPEIVEAVLEGDPDWTLLPANTPGRIRQLLRQCLIKDPARRPPDIGAVDAAIESVIAARRGWKQQRIVAAVAVVAALAIGVALMFALRRGAGGAQHIQSILVIPFENESRDPDVEYLSDGIAEGLIGSLAALPDVRVVARTTAFQFKGKPVDLQQIRKQVNADAVITGRLLSRSNDIIVQADLIDVKSGTQLWAGRFHDQNADVLDVERAMVTRISQALRGRLSKVPVPPTTNAEAYRLYLEGRYHWNTRRGQALQKAHDLFQQAIARDPKFALAYSGLADSTNMLSSANLLPRELAFVRARAAAETAVRLDPGLADGHASLGLIYANEFIWVAAEREFKRALALNPNHANAMLWYSYVLLARGRVGESLAIVREALEVDPLSRLMNMNLALRLNVLGRYDEALVYAQRAAELDPFSSGVQMATAYEGLGQPEKAIAEYERIASMSELPGNETVVRVRADMLRGEVARARNRVPPLVQRAERGEVLNTYVGWAYASVGDRDEAIRWLNRAFEAREPYFRNQCRGVYVRDLLTDPRYQDLLRRLARGFEE